MSMQNLTATLAKRLPWALPIILCGSAFALTPTVLTVPFEPTSPTTPHTTYPGANVILGATAPNTAGSTDSFTVTWDFGDGSATTTFALTNPYDLSTTHVFPKSAGTGTIWIATVTVTDTTTSSSGSGKYYVIQEANNLSTRVNLAIDWGLWYLHQTMWRNTTTVNSKTIPWGGWDTQTYACNPVNGEDWACYYYGSIDAENVQALEVNGHLATGPATDPYTDDVARGLNRMLTFLTSESTTTDTYNYNPATANFTCSDGSVPTTSDPTCTGHGGQHFYNSGATSCTSPPCVVTYDGNKNGLMTYSNDGSGEYSYTTSPFLDALVASGTPKAVAQTGSVGIVGETYATIVQDILDFYGYSQYGSDYDVSVGYVRGGGYSAQGGAWLYGPQQGDDNSTSQWAAIGFISGFRGQGFAIPIPKTITDFNNVWITNAQDLTDPSPTGADPFTSGDNMGAYGYRGSFAYSNAWGPFAVTPSGLVQMAMDGIGRTTNTVFGDSSTNFDQRWNYTESFYADNFCNSTSSGAYYAPRAYMYGMYSFTKSMLLHDPAFTLQPITYLRTLTPNVFTTNKSVPANTIDWYNALSSANGGSDPCDGVAQTLLGYQNTPADGVVDGHWYGFDYSGSQFPYETAWALIMLKRTVFGCDVNSVVGAGTPGGSIVAPRIDLTWKFTGSVAAASYDVLRSTSSAGPFVKIGSSTLTDYSDRTGLSNGDTYYYEIAPVTNGVESCLSQPAESVTIPKGR